MTIDDMIKSGALIDKPTGGTNTVESGGGMAALSVARRLEPAEQECWDKYKSALQRGQSDANARKAASK